MYFTLTLIITNIILYIYYLQYYISQNEIFLTLNYSKKNLYWLNLFNIFNFNSICTFKYIAIGNSTTCSNIGEHEFKI